VRKAVMMGQDIVVMMRASGWRDLLWYYTLAIPVIAGMLPVGLLVMLFNVPLGATVAISPLALTLVFLIARFRRVSTAVPRWLARWIVIWPYSFGIVKGLLAGNPRNAIRGRRRAGTSPAETTPNAGATGPEGRSHGRPLTPGRPLIICLTCSHGGHLAEMLRLAGAFEGHKTFYFCYDADTTRRLPNAYRVPNMARNPVEFAKNISRVYRLFRRERPDLVVSTGAEIAIPVVLVAKLARVATLHVECGAQVTIPSFTGRVLYHLVDRFYVQWPELLAAYGPRARYVGSLIDETRPFRAGGQDGI
jgi:hypothetical protein